MKVILAIIFSLLAQTLEAQHVFSVKGNKTYLDDTVFHDIGLRCSNALISDQAVDSLIRHLDEYQSYGLNTISVYLLGSRYSNIYGYNLDGTLNPVYQQRLEKIIEACDRRKMVVLVGTLYWGSGQHGRSNEYYAAWGQEEVNAAMRNTVQWLTDKGYRNVFIDPDNEGMAERAASFNIGEMICQGKKINPDLSIAYNGKGYPPPCADLSIHFANQIEQLPYIETEGTPSQYWGDYSKEVGLNKYINVGIYTEGKKAQQLVRTQELLDQEHGYLLASTWLQNVPPRFDLGGDGTACDPGIRWWCEFIRDRYKNANQ